MTWMSVPQMPQASGRRPVSPTLRWASRSRPLSFDSSHREASDELLLRDPACQKYRQTRERGRGGELGIEQPSTADEADQEDRRRGRDRRCEVDGVEELVPAEDETDQRRGGDSRGYQRHHDPRELTEEAGTVHAGRFKKVVGNLE